jgi:hypothetical protein
MSTRKIRIPVSEMQCGGFVIEEYLFSVAARALLLRQAQAEMKLSARCLQRAYLAILRDSAVVLWLCVVVVKRRSVRNEGEQCSP